MPDDSPQTPAPGWYPHPVQPGSELYWDGTGWTDRSRPAIPQAPRAPVYGTPPSATGSSSPYPAGDASSPYAQNPNAQVPYRESPYAQNPSATNPYASPAAGRNPLAIASLVLGILSILFNPLFVPSILAIVFGVRGRTAAAVVGTGRGFATAGLATGIAGIVFGGISFLVNVGSLLTGLSG